MDGLWQSPPRTERAPQLLLADGGAKSQIHQTADERSGRVRNKRVCSSNVNQGVAEESSSYYSPSE